MPIGEGTHRFTDPVKLTPHEEEVARLVAEGLSNQAIANKLSTTQHSAENVLRSIYSKLGLKEMNNGPKRVKLALWYKNIYDV